MHVTSVILAAAENVLACLGLARGDRWNANSVTRESTDAGCYGIFCR
jgi:hypothetical protein